MKVSLLFKFIRKSVRKYPKKYSRDYIFRGLQDITIHVLGNGPSLNKSLYLIKPSDYVMMVNYAVLTDLFFDVKPRFLCLADPAYFETTDDEKGERKKGLNGLTRM